MKQRGSVPFDKRFFSKKSQSENEMSTQEKFEYIYQTNFWSGQSSVSGDGSDDIQTEVIREALPKIISNYKIQSMLDLPCGDFNWMKTIELNLSKYIGADIVDEIININNKNYSSEKRRFVKLDLINDKLPATDLIFCRDCLVHFSNDDVWRSIKNIKQNNIKYLLTTTFPDCEENESIVTGDWRIINLEKEPFNFSKPLLLINEKCTEANGTYSDKSLGLWKVSDL